jgi:hypothetical protein
MPRKPPRVTVALGSCRPGGLDIAFSGLAKQSYDDFEVLFVDGRYHKRHQRVMAAARAYGLIDRVGEGSFIHVPNHRNQPEGSLWTTPCAGFNTALMLAAGDIVVFMMDYAFAQEDWLSSHAKAHDEGPAGGRFVMGPYHYWPNPPVRTKDGLAPKVFRVGDVRGADVVAQREQFNEAYLFGTSWTAAMVGVAPAESHRVLPEGPLDVTWCHTKNESFPRLAALAINGFPEWYDRVCGPGDTDFAFQLGQAGLQGYCAAGARLDAIDMRWILTNGSIVVPKGGFSDDPMARGRPYYDLGAAFYERRTGIAGRINNHYSLEEKSLEIWDWRRFGAMEETVIPRTEMADDDYFPEWHTSVVDAIARGEKVTV